MIQNLEIMHTPFDLQAPGDQRKEGVHDLQIEDACGVSPANPYFAVVRWVNEIFFEHYAKQRVCAILRALHAYDVSDFFMCWV